MIDWPPDPNPYALEEEVLDLLRQLADAALAVPRPERRFHVRRAWGGSGEDFVFGAPLDKTLAAAPQDLRSLRDEKAIECENYNTRGTYEFFITPLGYAVVENLKQRGEPVEDVEVEAFRYVDAADFRSRFPEAARKLSSARELAASDPIENATRIGHDCREAMMVFAAALAEAHAVAEDTGPTQTANKIRAVLDKHREALGGRTSAMLDALVRFWRAVADLGQRQEHGEASSKPLTVDDARRVVFYTGLVMYELDRTLGDTK